MHFSKMFDISFIKTPPRNSMFIHLVYKDDKTISFIYIFILNLVLVILIIYKGKH